MLCKKCGCEIPDGSKVCSYCGTETAILKEEKKRKAKKQAKWGCLAFIVIFVLILIGSCSSVKDSSVSNNSITQNQSYSIGMTPNEFKDCFNTISSTMGTKDDLIITKLNVEKDNTFKYDFGNDLVLGGSVNKEDGKICETFLVAKPSAYSDLQNMRIVLAFTYFIGAANPDLEMSQYRDVLADLGFLDSSADDLRKLDEVTVRGDVIYKMTAKKIKGFIVISAKHKNNAGK